MMKIKIRVLYLFLSLFCSFDTEGFFVQGPATPLIVQLGASVTLPCSADPPIPLHELEVQWMREDSGALVHLFQEGESRPESQSPPYSGRAQFFTEEISKGDFSLLLMNVTTEDKGLYKCVVHSEQKANETKMKLVVERLVVRGANVPIFAYAGEDAVLNCSVDTHVPLRELEVEWMKTNEEIPVLLFAEGQNRPESQHERFRGRAEFFREEIPKGNFSLKLRDVKTEDRGEFMCTVHTDRESVNATAWLQEQGFSTLHRWVLGLSIAAIVFAVLSCIPAVLWIRKEQKEENNEGGETVYIALSDFKADREGCPSFQMGETFHVIKKEECWWNVCSLNTGNTGYIPSSHVAPVDSLKKVQGGEMVYIALCNFVTDEGGCLNFRKGETFHVIEKKECWWNVCSLNTGNTGYIPSSRVALVDSLKKVQGGEMVYIALCNFVTDEGGCLNFRKGETFHVIEKKECWWNVCSLNTGNTGDIPSSRVALVDSLKKVQGGKKVFIALHDFRTDQGGYLSFEKDEPFHVIKKEESWWEVRSLITENTGYIHKSCVVSADSLIKALGGVTVFIALRDFAADREGYLSFQKGETFHIIEKEASQLDVRSIKTGNSGCIPRSYVTPVHSPMKGKDKRALLLYCLQVSIPCVLISIAFAIWGKIEGSFGEAYVCSAINLLRILMIFKVAPYKVSGTCYKRLTTMALPLETLFIRTGINSVVLHNALTFRADAGAKLLTGFMFAVVLLFDLSAVCVSGIKYSSGYSYLRYVSAVEIFFLLFARSTFGFSAVFIMWFIVPCVNALLDNWNSDWSSDKYEYLFGKIVKSLQYIFEATLFILILHMISVQDKEHPAMMCFMTFIYILTAVMRFDHRTNLPAVPHILVYVFGSAGLSVLNSAALAAELFMKAGKGERTVEDLRVIVLPFESFFLAFWLGLQVYAYCTQEETIKEQLELILQRCRKGKKKSPTSSQENQMPGERVEMEPLSSST